MKNILIPAILVLAFAHAASCQNSTVRSIEFSKMSRGYDERVTLSADSIHVWIENNRGEKSPVTIDKKITKDEWTSLLMIIKNIDLNEVPALPSPTMKRAVDAAMHSTLTITTSDGKTFAHGFDDDNPHKIMFPLLKRIREISGDNAMK